MNCSQRRIFVRWGVLLLLTVGFDWATPLTGQTPETDSAFAAIPFDRWLAEGPAKQIPWEINVLPARLSLHQRLFTRIEIEVDGEEFVKRCCQGQAVALVQITDQQGQVYRNQGIKELQDTKRGFQQYVVNFSWGLFLLPGKYKIVLAFYYSGREAHSLGVETLRVRALKDDPLPDAWSGLPNVEFFGPEANDLDEYFLPEMTGKLRLPVQTRRPVQMDLLVNLTPSRMEQLHPAWYRFRLARLLPILKTFGQIDVRNCSLNLVILDFTRNRVAFEQSHVKDVDWDGLKDALAATNTVDVHNLGDTSQFEVFFREELGRRLNERAQIEKAESNPPIRFIIVISSSFESGQGKPMAIPVPEKRDYVVYYIREGPPLSDGIGKVMRNLKPRMLSVDSPEVLRKHIALILDEISHL